MTNEPTSMDFEIDKTVGNEGEYGVKFNEPTTHEYAAYECQECGFNGDVEIINKTVTCPVCGTVNDVWKEGETPPPNHRDEPTTCEIVATLRRGCLIVHRQAADRLESQERVIAELTARAKSAERERDAAIADFEEFMFDCDDTPCKYCASYQPNKKCYPYKNCDPKYKCRSGLQPQDGGDV